MKFDDYQKGTAKTAIYPPEIGLAYVALGLAGEAGEVANKIKKIYRDKKGLLDDETRAILKKEIGDVLWYVSQLSTELQLDLGEVAQDNLDKLMGRKERGTISGDGDNR